MSVRQLVPPILRGEESTDLKPDTRNRLEQIALDAHAAGDTTWLRDEAAGRLRQANASLSVEYLLAAACRLNGEAERAEQTLLSLGERLIAKKQWEPLAAVAERALEIENTHAGARLLVRAHEGLGKDPARIDALQRAFGMLHDDLELGLLLAVRLGEAGQAEERRVLLAELLPRFAAEGRNAGLEEVALEFVEHADVEGAVRLLQTLPAVQGDHAVRECRQLLDIVFPLVSGANRAGEAADAIRTVAVRAVEALGPAAAEPFRAALVEALRQGPAAAFPDPEGVIRGSGVADAARPLVDTLARYDAIAALPPGGAVMHTGFGAGRITANDGENVVLDFAKSRGHRMPNAAARRTLTPLAENDLRLLRVTDPPGLAKLVAEKQGEVIVRVLAAIGGAADVQKLKVFVVGSELVKPTEWTTFWRKARAALEKDPRVDTSRAFEQHYKLAESAPDAIGGPLPGLQPNKPVRTNLSTIRKFLSQHPEAEVALFPRFGKYIARAVLDPEGELADRARAGLFFARWFPERGEEWQGVLRTLWERGLVISDLSGEDEQRGLLEAAHVAGVESGALLSALDSRFSSVRVRAEELLAHIDDSGRAALRRTLLADAPRYPGAALRVIEDDLDRELSEPERWRVFRAVLSLIEHSPKPSTADKVLGWIASGGLFDAMLDGTPCPEDVRLEIRVLLRQWRSSDRYLFPAIEAAERLGLSEEVEAVHAARQKSSERLFANVGQQAEDTQLSVMTRATWQRLKAELDRLERELRTTIPRTIQKARELGDLRENAEYHSAKQKQANVSKLVRGLQQRLLRARFVDDAEVKDGIVGLGTEVVLESDTQDIVRYWILGEEEHHHGDHVVSFQAPVGRALMGHAIGDEVAFGDGANGRRYHIVSVERRLPPVEDEPATQS